MSSPSAEWEAWSLRDALYPEERRALLEVDDRHGWISLAVNWALVFAAFALGALAPGFVWTVLACGVALFVIGARQLGLAVLMHEAAHGSLFAHAGGGAFTSWRTSSALARAACLRVPASRPATWARCATRHRSRAAGAIYAQR